MITKERVDEQAVMDGMVGRDSGDDVVHYYCRCNEDLALCGLDLRGAFADGEDATLCPLCVVANEARPCPSCGS